LPVYGLALAFTALNAAAWARHWWSGIYAVRPDSWGTVALPLSVPLALGTTWSVSLDRLFAFRGACLVLALADPAASWVGERTGETTAESWTATVPGSLAFAGLALGLSVVVLGGGTAWPWENVLAAAVGTSLIATPVEAVSRRGWDNLFVPLALILLWVPLGRSAVGRELLSTALLSGLVFGGLAYRTWALNAPGAVVGGLFAVSLVGLGGVAWVVPGIVFFGVSSALTFLCWAPGASGTGSPRRTSAQVLANGGVPWTALGMYGAVPPEVPGLATASYAVFVGALAAAAADTWGTDLGTRFASVTWSLRTGRAVPASTSGAVSLLGTGGAVLGAASVVGAALLTNGSLTGSPWRDFGGLVGAGFLGAVADSLVGAFVQAHYKPDTDAWRETPPVPGAAPVRGVAGVGNNAVDVIGTTVGGGAAPLGVVLVAWSHRGREPCRSWNYIPQRLSPAHWGCGGGR
jgi:uncharacterized membrane protein